MNTANETYRYLLETIMLSKSEVAPRGQGTREYIGFQTKVDMQYPIVTIPERKLNYRFMAAEAYWILKGLQGLDELSPYCERMKDFSDDGITLAGAYGPRFLSQVRYVVDALRVDYLTRQAVMTLWERNPRHSKDIPCTVSLQWMIRGNKIHCNVFMRSSDCWLGWPYDVFSFTMMTAYILISLGFDKVTLGDLRIFAGSQHLYDRDMEKAQTVIGRPFWVDGDILPITLSNFNTPDALLNALGGLRNAPNDKVLLQFQELCHSK